MNAATPFQGRRHRWAGAWFAGLWVVLVLWVFDRYAYEIEDFNSRVRVFLTTGSTSLRSFDENGLPTSHSARSGARFVSPFYVVHYGLIYSESDGVGRQQQGFHWRADSSTELWNVPPSRTSIEYFRNCADWVVDRLRFEHGRAHLVYEFDWSYPNYPGGQLEAPWWSGLTDGFAIVLLLRAYDVFADSRYRDAAVQLYESVLAPVAEGGSLIRLDDDPWIEEYVDPRVDPARMSFVLNGMIYATYGVDAFERYFERESRIAPALYESIAAHLRDFDLGAWSYYDRIGTPANMKYHRIHVALLGDLFEITGDQRFESRAEQWQTGVEHPGWFWVRYGGFSVSKLQFLLMLAIAAGTGPMVLAWLRRQRSQQGSAAQPTTPAVR